MEDSRARNQALPKTSEPAMSAEVAARRKTLRTGFTTGTCASAAAKAAAIGLVSGVVPETVEVGLPRGERVRFHVEGAGVTATRELASAVVVKDAGDDPDCTDGARMTATLEWLDPVVAPTPPIGPPRSSELVAGSGVGVVTKPGLGLPVGAPAINPVPKKMILAALDEVPGVCGSKRADRNRRPVRVVLSVPGGDVMAEKTTNARLGIVGGISILGTTGIVRPFSTAAFRASVVQQIKVAAAQGEPHIVLCTGSRSEKAALALYPTIDDVCVVEVGDFTGIALRNCSASHITTVSLVAMAGKITKLAAGTMMTHFHRSNVDTDLLAKVATDAGAPGDVVAAAYETTTARHFYDACVKFHAIAPLELLCELARDRCVEHAGGATVVEVIMVDFEGEEVIARA